MPTKFGKIGKMTFICQAGVPKRVGNMAVSIQKYSIAIFELHHNYASLVKISPVIPEIANITALFWTRLQKSECSTKYLDNY